MSSSASCSRRFDSRKASYLYRRVREDVEFEGFHLPAGWLIRVCVWESHRAADTFEDPEAFDPDRFLAAPFTAVQYSPFGRGAHACYGVPLAMLVARTGVEELARGSTGRSRRAALPSATSGTGATGVRARSWR